MLQCCNAATMYNCLVTAKLSPGAALDVGNGFMYLAGKENKATDYGSENKVD